MEKHDYLPTRILHDFTGRIEQLGMNYMLTGSMAMMLYGMYRQTADIDIVVEFDGCDLIAFQKALEPDYYVPVEAMNNAVMLRRDSMSLTSNLPTKLIALFERTALTIAPPSIADCGLTIMVGKHG